MCVGRSEILKAEACEDRARGSLVLVWMILMGTSAECDAMQNAGARAIRAEDVCDGWNGWSVG